MTEMSKKEFEDLASLVAKKTAEEMLTRLGIDTENTRESQADFLHLRKTRLASEQIGKMAFRVVLTTAITGVLSVVLVSLKEHFTK